MKKEVHPGIIAAAVAGMVLLIGLVAYFHSTTAAVAQQKAVQVSAKKAADINTLYSQSREAGNRQ